MEPWLKFIAKCFLLLNIVLASFANIHLNQWAVQVYGGHKVADRVAKSLGFVNKGQIGSLEDHYEFIHHGIEKRSTSPSHHHHQLLISHSEVMWAEQQIAKKRVKRDFRENLAAAEENSFNTPKFLKPDVPEPLLNFNDPLYPDQWYLNGGASGGFDMNVKNAWRRGYTGKGVVVTILDDGLEKNHTDLIKNYDALASFDINSEDDDPMPRYDSSNENRHGTRCAGEVAAQANNSKCGVGIAYHAGIGGVRMLDGDVSDLVESRSLSLQPNYIDIYSASWGPDDNGMVVDGPATLAKKAFKSGVTTGRGGKGSIFVWASGNGGSNHDSCNCDGYTNSIYTLSISSVSEKNWKPWYLEECSSTLATTYSSGATYEDRQVVSTDLRNQCTESHTGTSASAPLAAAICALALEANPSMTWRDMQYITLMTARPEPFNDGEWIINGLNRRVSLKYGYGLMDADAMVQLAEVWTTVPEQRVCEMPPDGGSRSVTGSGINVSMSSTGCRGNRGQQVSFLEHVQVRVTLRYSRRGDVKLNLISPQGTNSTLLPRRPKDYEHGEFKDWPFMSVHFWGENPIGVWNLEIHNTGDIGNTGVLTSFQLILYGTATQPVRLKSRETVKSMTQNDHTSGRSHSRGHGFLDELWSRSNKDQGDMAPTTNSYHKTDYQYYDIQDRIAGETGSRCHSECDGGCTGPDPDECVACRHFRKGNHGPCVSSCQHGEYADSLTMLCHRCHSSCNTCKGPGPEKCFDCPEGYHLIEDQGRCVSQCPDSYYAGGHSCYRCDGRCLTCVGSAEICTACREAMELEGHVCIQKCRPNQYRDKEGSCHMCHISCEMCSGPSQFDCVRCPGGAFYKNGTCVHECGLWYYEDIKLWECQSCHSSCLRCSGPQSNQCTRCTDDMKLDNSRCVERDETCHDDEFKDPSGHCQKCDSNCKTCKGEKKWDCLSCSSERLYLDGQCLTECRPGYYEYDASGLDASLMKECRECHRNCRLCKGGRMNDCTSCEGGLVLVDGECRTNCADGQYQDSNGHCTDCDVSCSHCTGPGREDCTKCSFMKVLFNGACTADCPSGYYKNMDKECFKCHHTCKTCTGGGPATCLSCQEGYIIYRGFCIKFPTCATNMFYSTEQQECQLCDKLCHTCRGPGPNNCTSCIRPYIHNAQHHQCILCCSGTQRENCCTCHPETGVCVEGRHIQTDNNWQNLFHASTDDVVKSHVTLHSIAMSTYGLVMIAVLCCIFIVIIFFAIFGLLQSYTEGYGCFRKSVAYQKLPIVYDHNTDHILLTKEDFEGDDDEDDEIYGRNDHMSNGESHRIGINDRRNFKATYSEENHVDLGVDLSNTSNHIK